MVVQVKRGYGISVYMQLVFFFPYLDHVIMLYLGQCDNIFFDESRGHKFEVLHYAFLNSL